MQSQEWASAPLMENVNCPPGLEYLLHVDQIGVQHFSTLVGLPRPSIQPYRFQYLSNSNQLRLDQIWLLYTIDTATDRLVFGHGRAN